MKCSEVIFETLYSVPSRNGVYKPQEFHGSGCRIVNMGEMFGYDFISNQEMKRLEMSDAELTNSSLEDGDLLFGRRSLVEAGAGKCSIVMEPSEPLTFESSIIRARLNKDRVNPLFYYYYFRSSQGRGLIRSIVSGTNVKGIRGSDLRKLLVVCPSKEIQNAVAITLYLYDELIENNRRRMALLEEVARLLYKEWFVHLRFPGHEHAQIKNGIPDGWERKPIGDIADCIGGGTPSTTTPEYWDDGTITWITPTDVTRNSHFVLLEGERRITEAGLKNSSSKMVPPNAVLMTSRASVGFFAIMNREVCTNQGFISIVPKDSIFSSFLLFQLSERVEEIRTMGSGSTYPEVSRGKFREFQIVVPERRLVVDFDEQATLILTQIRVLKQQNQKLQAARDILLPRLINGEIQV